MIRADNISKSFGTKRVIRDISFTVEGGEVLTLAGPSGCGKSTILNIVSGLIPPDSGSAVCSSEKIGYAFQKDILIPWKSALENVLYVMKNHLSPKAAYDSAVSILEQMGLADDMYKKPAMMSGGMKKRVNIARAISVKPDILLLDEPFVYLDDKNIELVKEIIRESVTACNSAVIIVTHDMKHAGDFPGNLIDISSHRYQPADK